MRKNGREDEAIYGSSLNKALNSFVHREGEQLTVPIRGRIFSHTHHPVQLEAGLKRYASICQWYSAIQRLSKGSTKNTPGSDYRSIVS